MSDLMHASVELFWMIEGFNVTCRATFTSTARDRFVSTTMCGHTSNATGDDTVWGVWWRGNPDYAEPAMRKHLGWGPHEETVTCPECLVAMDAAREGRVLA